LESSHGGRKDIPSIRPIQNIGIDGVEFEFQGRPLLADPGKREKLARDVADVLLEFVNQYYTDTPFKKPD
jgi:hypothetical protein